MTKFFSWKRKPTEDSIICLFWDQFYQFIWVVFNLAALYCDRLVFFKNGRIVIDGPTEKTFNDENLSKIYEADIRVSRHPVTGNPQAHFVPGHARKPQSFDHVSGRQGAIQNPVHPGC